MNLTGINMFKSHIEPFFSVYNMVFRLFPLSASTVRMSEGTFCRIEVQFVFSHLSYWSGNFFLIAQFPDHCLLFPSF